MTFSTYDDLLLFYANAGAYPVDANTLAPIQLPPAQSTALPRVPGFDAWTGYTIYSSLVPNDVTSECWMHVSSAA